MVYSSYIAHLAFGIWLNCAASDPLSRAYFDNELHGFAILIRPLHNVVPSPVPVDRHSVKQSLLPCDLEGRTSSAECKDLRSVRISSSDRYQRACADAEEADMSL